MGVSKLNKKLSTGWLIIIKELLSFLVTIEIGRSFITYHILYSSCYSQVLSLIYTIYFYYH